MSRIIEPITLRADITLSDPASLQLAIGGYMADRAALVKQIASVDLYYEREVKKRGWLEQEIQRIDIAVASLLHGLHTPKN